MPVWLQRSRFDLSDEKSISPVAPNGVVVGSRMPFKFVAFVYTGGTDNTQTLLSNHGLPDIERLRELIEAV